MLCNMKKKILFRISCQNIIITNLVDENIF